MDIMVNKAFPSTQYKADPYEEGLVKPTPLIQGSIEQFDTDSRRLITEESLVLKDNFVKFTAWPLLQTLFTYRNIEFPKYKRIELACNILSAMPEKSDWKLAAQEWLQRRTK